MKKWIWMVAGSVITALVFLVFNPEVRSDVGRRMFASTHDFDPGAWSRETRQAAEAGDPYAQMNYGLMLLHGSDRLADFDDREVATEPERGRQLMESAAAKGLTQSLFMLWWSTGRTDDALLQRAADLGDPGAITEVLKRTLEGAECTPEGRAAFDESRPSLEQLVDARNRFRAFLAAYPPPETWARGFSESVEHEFTRVAGYLESDLLATDCVARGTPIPTADAGA